MFSFVNFVDSRWMISINIHVTTKTAKFMDGFAWILLLDSGLLRLAMNFDPVDLSNKT